MKPVDCDIYIYSLILHFVLVNSVLYKLVRCMYILLLIQRLDLKYNRLILFKIKNLIYVHVIFSELTQCKQCASCDMNCSRTIAKNTCVPHQKQHVRASKDNTFIEDITSKVRFTLALLDEATTCTKFNRL